MKKLILAGILLCLAACHSSGGDVGPVVAPKPPCVPTELNKYCSGQN